jgi:hypothetical protein
MVLHSIIYVNLIIIPLDYYVEYGKAANVGNTRYIFYTGASSNNLYICEDTGSGFGSPVLFRSGGFSGYCYHFDNQYHEVYDDSRLNFVYAYNDSGTWKWFFEYYPKSYINTSSSKHSYLEGTATIITPAQDITIQGSWKNESDGGILYPSLADSSDSTYAYIDIGEGSPGDYFEVGLNSPEGNPTGSYIFIWKVYKKAGGLSSLTLKCELYQGSTPIASDLRTITDESVIEFARELTDEEISLFDGYNNLKLRITILS